MLPFLVMLAAILAAMSLDRPLPRAEIVVVQVADCFTLDPQRMSYMQDLRMARSLYEGLVRNNNQTLAIEPAVAESWKLSDDGLTWTFHLRDDSRWSNGDPVTAGDFVYSWRRALMPGTAADYSNFFHAIDGAKEFFEWRVARIKEYTESENKSPEAARALLDESLARFDETVGLEAVDEKTLRVTLEKPLTYFLDLCAFGVLVPVHPPTVESHVMVDPNTGTIRQDHGWTEPGTIVTNGPYLLKRRRYKRDIRLERNPLYWNQDAVIADSVEVRCIEDPNTSVLAFQVGTIDWVIDVQAEYRADMAIQARKYLDEHSDRFHQLLDSGMTIDEALAGLPEPRGDQRRDLHMVPAFGTYFFSFNCRERLSNGRKNPLAEPAVRRALALAVDKQSIIDLVLRTGEPLAESLVPPGSIPGYTPPDGLGFDPERARRELAVAGWTRPDDGSIPHDSNGERFPTIDLLYTTDSPRLRDMALTLRDMWRTHLGIETALRAKETKAYREDLRQGNYMVARGGWYGDYGDPMTFLDLSRSTDGNNDRGYKSEVFDAMLDEASDQLDPEVRFQQLSEVEGFLVRDAMPILPIYHYTMTYMYEPARLRGLTRHPRLEQNYWQLKMITREE